MRVASRALPIADPATLPTSLPSRFRRELIRLVRPLVPARTRRLLRTVPRRWRLLETYGAWQRSPGSALRYLLTDPELDNFTYRISNTDRLASLLADALGIDASVMSGYIRELQADRRLRTGIEDRLAVRVDRRRTMPYGRRLGWYAVVRHLKPRLVVETGILDGLGSTVLLRALERNAAEGVDGRLLSVDIRSDAGWLIPDELRLRHEVLIGDSLALLGPAIGDRRVGFFVHDSDHAYGHETAEFETILPLTEAGAALVSDDAHASTAFADFCGRHDLTYRYWRERPFRHFYPGAGIGLARVD